MAYRRDRGMGNRYMRGSPDELNDELGRKPSNVNFTLHLMKTCSECKEPRRVLGGKYPKNEYGVVRFVCKSCMEKQNES